MVDLSAGNVIRLGSGVLFAALGVAVLAIGRRRAGALALGAHFLLAGTWIVASNLTEQLWAPLDSGLSIVMWSAGLLAGSFLPAPLARRELPAFALALVIPLLATIPALLVLPLEERPLADFLPWAANWTVSAAAFLLPAFRLTTAASVDRSRVAQAAGLSLPGALWIGSGLLGAVTWDPHVVSPFVATVLVLASSAGAWIFTVPRGGGRLAIVVAWSSLAVALLGYAIATLARVVIGEDPYGFSGISRILGWTAAAVAIIRADLLGVPLPRIAARRGTVTTAALASFFIAAEIAQNFLADEYGLLMGGVVAGALLFAARPIERAMERNVETSNREASRVAPVSGPASGAARREDVYRKAVRVAIADHALTRDEDVHLYELADELGIGAGRAAQIRREVEGEAR